MRLVPQQRVRRIEFYESHLHPWQAHAAEIGLTSTFVSELADLTAEARAAILAHREAEEAAKAATQRFHDAVAAMQGKGAAAIRVIRNTAETQHAPNVYSLAEIAPPKDGSKTPPPGIPSQLKVELLATGALRLTWKCNNPDGTTGTLYEIKRRMVSRGMPGAGENAEFVYIGASGVKRFIDTSLPPGPTRVTYQITAIRSTRASHPAQFTINFGVEGEEQRGGLTITDVAA